MSCSACKSLEALICSKCICNEIEPLKSELHTLESELLSKKSKLKSLLSSLPSQKLQLLQSQSSLLQRSMKLSKDRESLETLRSTLKQKQDLLNSLKNAAQVKPLQIPASNTTELSSRIEKIRKGLIQKASEVFENNVYFPEYCISDMFKIEKCMSYSQIIKDDIESVSVDKPNFVISLKNMIISYQSDEHNQAVNFSISQIAFFLNSVSLILNMELPFPLSYKYKCFQVKDWAGTKLAMNIFEPYECENALIYLYENLRVLQQHSGVDFNKVKGIFDIRSLVESAFLARYFDIPSIPLPIRKEEVKKIQESEEEEDWELLDESD